MTSVNIIDIALKAIELFLTHGLPPIVNRGKKKYTEDDLEKAISRALLKEKIENNANNIQMILVFLLGIFADFQLTQTEGKGNYLDIKKTKEALDEIRSQLGQIKDTGTTNTPLQPNVLWPLDVLKKRANDVGIGYRHPPASEKVQLIIQEAIAEREARIREQGDI
ncbi:MAG: hypothetical protein FWH26_01830 [Oscillospiraceae bacterium]|nr:hypothetical protein [Oscillospiraceae bacterium]